MPTLNGGRRPGEQRMDVVRKRMINKDLIEEDVKNSEFWRRKALWDEGCELYSRESLN
jgi:hypothetical protein